MDAAAVEYTRRGARRRTELERLRGMERRLSTARMFVFLAAGAVAVGAVDTGWASPWWAMLPVAVFAGLVVRHDAVIRERQCVERLVAFYDRGVARLEDRWMGGGSSGERYLDTRHPYAADLDLFGQGSLFQLLCTAQTRAGETALADWLRTPAAIEEIYARQEAVRELAPRLDLREDLAGLGEMIEGGVHPDVLAAWGAAPPVFSARWPTFVAPLLVAVSCGTGIAMVTVGVSPWLWLGAVTAQVGVALVLRRRVAQVLRAVEVPQRDLRLLAALLARIELEPVASPRLLAVRARLHGAGGQPSQRIAQLGRLVHLLDARRNELFGAFAALLLWGTQCALAIERWRAVHGQAVGHWLAAIGEIEALCAIAGYAYERAEDSFPEVARGAGCFEATQLGHPLIPMDRCVRNDVRLGTDLRLLVVSGSNMSGKSTLLRSVGANTVLALMGAPVRARSLRLSELTVGASMRVVDSLQTGTSHFYAEITRLRDLLTLAAGPRPLLFLLDEILQGTNSHDRCRGAEAVLRGLLERGAMGLVTTHDLALTQVVEALAPHAANVHFEDHLEGGTMRFDYRMRPGVVQRSNAVALMRAVGLEV